ncbi:MAG: hypothetical protein LBE80_09015 [Deltaproteobacteria bacterium]|jgi:hypothetical protein|nr:hypothetical protein [Deltaproteobacteria bacterium]
MFKKYFVWLVWLSAFMLALAASPGLAQDVLGAPITQADIDGFLNIYGQENPPAAAESVGVLNYDRLSVVVKRLTMVYVLRGQHTEEEALLKKLAAIKVPHSVSSDEYNLYRANDEKLRPVFAKFLGSYTLRLPNSIAEVDIVEASNVSSDLDAQAGNFDYDSSEGYGPPAVDSQGDDSQPTINTEQLPDSEVNVSDQAS